MQKKKVKKGVSKDRSKEKKSPKKGAKKAKAGKAKVKLKKIMATVNKLHEKVALADARSAKPAVEAGRLLNKLKEQVKEEKKRKGKGLGWTKFVEKNFAHITMRTCQRYMSLADRIAPEEMDILCELGQTVLLDLIKKSKGQEGSVTKFIKNNGIEIPADAKDKEDVREFRNEVASFLNSRRKKKKATSGGAGNGNVGGDGDAGNQDKNPDADEPDDDQDDDHQDDDGADDDGEDDEAEKFDDDDLDEIGKEPPPKPKPKAMLRTLNEEGWRFSKAANVVIKNRKKMKRMKFAKKSLRDLDELVADLAKKLEALRKLRDSLKD